MSIEKKFTYDRKREMQKAKKFSDRLLKHAREPDPLMDPVGWRKWWLAINPGKSWDNSGVAWRAKVD